MTLRVYYKSSELSPNLHTSFQIVAEQAKRSYLWRDGKFNIKFTLRTISDTFTSGWQSLS